MTNFFLIRHAACKGVGHTLWGRTPGICLNEKGETQAQRLAERFQNIKLDAIYSSPLERALQTATAIARPMNLEVKQSAAANEINFGEWSGKTFEELHNDERWRQFNSHRSLTMVPGGESFREVQNRIVKEIEELALHHGKAQVAIVSHADVIRAAVAHFAATPIDMIERFEISPGSVSVLALNNDNSTLLTINNMSELTQLWA